MPNTAPDVPPHGASLLPHTRVDAYNAELRDDQGFVGDRASRRAFRSILSRWRERLREAGEDPLGDRATKNLDRRKLDETLTRGTPEAAGLVLTAVEEFAQDLVFVCRRLLRLDAWRNTQRIVIGGGFRASRIGELAIGRAGVLLKTADCRVEMRPIRHDPDQAALIGAWQVLGLPDRERQAILAVDIGGSKIRAGMVCAAQGGSPGDAPVQHIAVWRHSEEQPGRDDAVQHLADMLRGLIDGAGDRLAPLVVVACPGVVREDGSIARGGQNLPGNWSDPGFNLPGALRGLLPKIGGCTPDIVMHNDAVVQGISERPWMQDVQHWGVLTIGTGLGNARFTNLPDAAEDEA